MHRPGQRNPMSPLARRNFLAGSLAALGAPSIVRAQMHYPKDPFTLGVASGYPRPDRVALWTRLAPEPLDGGGMPPQPVEVTWEIAEDERFARIAGRGTARTDDDLGHSVHVDATGLQPGRWYWYRFTAGTVQSPVGRTRTAPADGSAVQRLRLAVASCQQYEQGWFSALRHMAAEDLDLVLHLGDYIYELSWGRSHVRRHAGGIPTELWEFRNRYAQYKTDPDLQAAHRQFPWMAIWDDHEVADDHTSLYAPRMTDTAQFLKTRAAAYQAWYEHMPVPPSMMPKAGGLQIYGRHRWGDLADILLLDDRQYRSPHPCVASRSAPRTVADCPARHDPARTMLGPQQEAWLDSALQQARGRWTLVAQQTLMAEAVAGTTEAPRYWVDGWDGYPAARQRLLDGIARHRPGGPLVLGGDVHSFCVADLKPRFESEASPTIATELVATSITSDPPRGERLRRAMARHPYMKLVDDTRRGWLSLDVGRMHTTAHLRTISDVQDPNASAGTLASFAIDQARPGAIRA